MKRLNWSMVLSCHYGIWSRSYQESESYISLSLPLMLIETTRLVGDVIGAQFAGLILILILILW